MKTETEIDATIIQVDNGWANMLLTNGTTYDCWNYPRELRIGDKLTFNTFTRRWEVIHGTPENR